MWFSLFFCSFPRPNKKQIQVFMIEFLRKTLSLNWGLAEVLFKLLRRWGTNPSIALISSSGQRTWRYRPARLDLHESGTSKFWAASCKNESNLLLVWITVCICSNRDLFRLTVLQKCGRDIKCSFDYGYRAALWWIFFYQIKVRQPIGRQDSMQTVIRNEEWILKIRNL